MTNYRGPALSSATWRCGMYGFATLAAALLGCFFASCLFYFMTGDTAFVENGLYYSLGSAVSLGSAIGALGFYYDRQDEEADDLGALEND